MRKQVNLWTTKSGERVRICDMEDDHLVNCVNMLRRYGQAILHYEVRALLSIRVHGEHAKDELECALDELSQREWHECVPTIFWKMINDIIRRMVLRPGIIKNLIGIPNWILGE